MKLILGCGNHVRPQGYVNVDNDIKSEYDISVYKQGNIENIDWLCEDNSVEEIVALNSINAIHYTKLVNMFTNWFQKLQKDGLLKISGPDIGILTKQFSSDSMSLNEFLNFVYGKDNKSILDMNSAVEILESCGFNIVTKKYDHVIFYVEAVK